MSLRQILNLNAPIRLNMKTIHCLLMSSWASGRWTSTHPFCHFDICVACSVWIQLTYSTVYICHFSVNNTSTWQLHNTFQTRSALIESIDPSQKCLQRQACSSAIATTSVLRTWMIPQITWHFEEVCFLFNWHKVVDNIPYICTEGGSWVIYRNAEYQREGGF